MKLVDTNVLVYIVNENAPQHPRVRAWWEAAIVDEVPIGLAWMVVLGFLRICTHPRVFARPLTSAEAIAKLEIWLSLPNIKVVTETEDHWSFLKRLLDEAGRAGDLTTDAHLAAIATAYGASIVSCDIDFRRFQKVRWENPLTTS
jgi:toxin-antitoxin system PIN domain toxin